MSRAHDSLVSGTDRSQPAFRSSPGHHRCIRCQTTIQDFIPSQQFASVTVQETFHPVNGITLQFIHVFQSFLLHTCLTEFAVRPGSLSGFISSDMDIFGREELHDLSQNVFQKFKRFFISDTEVRLLIRHMRTRQFRIGCQHFFRMGRHFDLRNNGYIVFLCISHQFPDIILCIIATLCTGIGFFTIFPLSVPPVFPDSLRTPCRKLGQTRILLDFNTPSGSIGQMQVKTVDLIVRQQVYLTFHKFFTAEMTGHIQHDTTVFKTRFILYGDSSHTFRSISSHLQKSLHTIEKSCTGQSFNPHSVGIDRKYISFR